MRRALRRPVSCAAICGGVLSLVGAFGCGGGTQGPVAVRIGAVEIGGTAVSHWARAAERGALLGGARALSSEMPRQRALGFLISSHWLVAEAKAEGFPAPGHAVQRALDERKEANGASEFQAGLASTGQTVADVKLEVEAEIAAATIREALARQAARVAPAEVAAYYRSNRRRFHVAEGRVVDLVENLASPAAAEALEARIGTGIRFTHMAYHESLERPARLGSHTVKEAVVRAIFTARSGVVSAPMRLNHHWTLFVVRKITPATTKPLAKVKREVVARLTAQRRRQIVTTFLAAYRQRWTARTSCRPGYEVPGCAQYTGRMELEEDPFSGM